jgi:chromosome segregation ATPase
MDENEIGSLFESGVVPSKSTSHLEIKTFCNKIDLIMKSKPVSSSQLPSRGISTRGDGSALEVERRFKKKVEALTSQIEETKSEVARLENQVKHWREIAQKNEKEKEQIAAKLVTNTTNKGAERQGGDVYSTPLEPGQLETVAELRERIHSLEKQNEDLNSEIFTHLKGDIIKYKTDADRAKKNLEEMKRQLNSTQDRLDQIARFDKGGKVNDKLNVYIIEK